MEVRQLNTLIRAAQFQSFSKAAESLGYSQSAVTVQIKALEEELGVRLFDRMNKRVLLTVDGQRFLEYANSILDTIQSARQALNENAELGGSLHIGTLESLCFFRLPGLIRQFRLEHPRVGLRVTTGSPEELIEKMEQGEVDLICILDEPRYSNNWHKCNEVPEEVVFVATPNIDLGHPGPYRVAELLDKPFFLTERNANYRRTFDKFLASHQVELTPSLEIGQACHLFFRHPFQHALLTGVALYHLALPAVRRVEVDELGHIAPEEGQQPPAAPAGQGQARFLPHLPEQAVLRALEPLKFAADTHPFIVVVVVLLFHAVEHQVGVLPLQIAERGAENGVFRVHKASEIHRGPPFDSSQRRPTGKPLRDASFAFQILF